MSWWAEHDGVARGTTSVRVRRGVVRSAIGLQFDEPDHHLPIRSVGDQPAAQQQPSSRQDINGQTLPDERRHRHEAAQARYSATACRARCSCSATRSGAVPP